MWGHGDRGDCGGVWDGKGELGDERLRDTEGKRGMKEWGKARGRGG